MNHAEQQDALEAHLQVGRPDYSLAMKSTADELGLTEALALAVTVPAGQVCLPAERYRVASIAGQEE